MLFSLGAFSRERRAGVYWVYPGSVFIEIWSDCGLCVGAKISGLNLVAGTTWALFIRGLGSFAGDRSNRGTLCVSIKARVKKGWV